MNNYERALSGYSNSAGEINSNLGAWRADVDNVGAANKAGLQSATQSAYQQVDLNAITGIGEEFAIKGAKAYGTKALGAIYERTGLKTLDRKLGKKILTGVRDATGRGGASASEVADTGEGVELSDFGNNNIGNGATGEPPMKDPSEPGASAKPSAPDADPIDPAADDSMSFDDFMDNFEGTPMTESGDIDFDAIDRSRNATNADAVRNEPTTEQNTGGNQDVDTRNTAGQAEADATPENLAGEADATNPTSALTNATDDATDAIKNVGGDAVDALKSGASTAKSILTDGKSALTSGVDDAIGDGLEGIGAALDATGVLAPLGVLAQVAGGALELGGIYQMGEGLANWWDTTILGDKPKVDFTAKKAPVAPQTLATRGLMAAPTMDSNFDIPSTAGGW